MFFYVEVGGWGDSVVSVGGFGEREGGVINAAGLFRVSSIR